MDSIYERTTKPFFELETCLLESKQKQRAVEVLRQLTRVLQLLEKARELGDDVMTASLRDLARQALLVHEIMNTVEEENLSLIHIIRKDIDWAASQHQLIRNRATRELEQAMKEPSLADIGSALQVREPEI
jgi:hypothetical protein